MRSPLVGRPNAYNILAAVAAAMALDVPFSAIEAGIAALANVPGRFQVVSDRADDVRVVVDYAHTDDALKNLLETARPLATGRVITVFGCGGDRDRTKRPLMGAVAARLSDLVIVTSDNPRSEDPEQIIEEIKRGIVDAGRSFAAAGQPRRSRPPCLAIVDRKAAIERAIRDARAGDLVLIAGKGHEKYQVIGDRDAAVRRRRGGARGAGAAARRVEGVVARGSAAADRRGRRGRRRRAADARELSATVDRGDLDRFADARRRGSSSSPFAATGSTGTRFVADALPRGARGRGRRTAMRRRRRRSGGARRVVIGVEDTTRALQDVARDVRRRSGAKVVAITGSAGKTTTKEVTADFLAARYGVFRNKGNLNNHIGLPLSLLELRSRPEVAVVELGMNHPGEIRTLVGIAEPEVRVWTNVGDAHLGFFASADAIADAKAEILEQARPTTCSSRMRTMRGSCARVGGFARPGRDVRHRQRPADVRAIVDWRSRARGDARRVCRRRRECGSGDAAARPRQSGERARRDRGRVAVRRSARRDHDARRGASAGAAARRAAAAAGRRHADRRFVQLEPAALRRALHTLADARPAARGRSRCSARCWSSGSHAERLHAECGAAAANAGLDVLIAVGGPPARALADAAIRAGMPAGAVSHVPTSSEAAALALERIRPGDLVLVKGSRGIGTDVVVDRLKAEFA